MLQHCNISLCDSRGKQNCGLWKFWWHNIDTGWGRYLVNMLIKEYTLVDCQVVWSALNAEMFLHCFSINVPAGASLQFLSWCALHRRTVILIFKHRGKLIWCRWSRREGIITQFVLHENKTFATRPCYDNIPVWGSDVLLVGLFHMLCWTLQMHFSSHLASPSPAALVDAQCCLFYCRGYVLKIAPNKWSKLAA